MKPQNQQQVVVRKNANSVTRSHKDEPMTETASGKQAARGVSPNSTNVDGSRGSARKIKKASIQPAATSNLEFKTSMSSSEEAKLGNVGPASRSNVTSNKGSAGTTNPAKKVIMQKKKKKKALENADGSDLASELQQQIEVETMKSAKKQLGIRPTSQTAHKTGKSKTLTSAQIVLGQGLGQKKKKTGRTETNNAGNEGDVEENEGNELSLQDNRAGNLSHRGSSKQSHAAISNNIDGMLENSTRNNDRASSQNDGQTDILNSSESQSKEQMPASPASKPTAKQAETVSLTNATTQGNRPLQERSTGLRIETTGLNATAHSPTQLPVEADIESPSVQNDTISVDSPLSADFSPMKKDNASFGITLKQLERVEDQSPGRGVLSDEEEKKDVVPLNDDSLIKNIKDVKQNNENLDMCEPLPLLPKTHHVFTIPPRCPLDTIRFIQLKKFMQFTQGRVYDMTAGFDLVGNRRRMIQQRTEEKIKKGDKFHEAEQIAKIDDTTHFIRSVIYARDPSIIDPEHGHIPQRAAFSHENHLDVKQMIRKRELLYGDGSQENSLSPRALARRFMPQPEKPKLDAQIYKLKDENDKTLLFESRFESGNLYLSQKVSDNEYNLLMQNDVNTQGHTQWFFFQVRNTRAKNKVRFNILNYSKPDSLFNYGMKVSVYSEKKAQEKQEGWHKDGNEISYYQNGIRKDITYYSKSYFSLTFTYEFAYDNDIVYFAYSFPYTYSDLRNDIATIECDAERSSFMTKKALCRTLSGENCDLLTITSRENTENFAQRKGVVITGRVHPGETVGSWMMRGVLFFLTDPNNEEARKLRQNFVFKVIPMLNPDGVINGNYRCSLAGCDLNRRWKAPSKALHPTIYNTKKLIKQVHQERGLVMYCDLHGHSRKQNVFMYGCNNKSNPAECRIFPFILSKMNPYFSFEYSRFGVQKSKESTARVAMYKELKTCPNIFTMESSFAGLDMGKHAGKHLTSEMLESLGYDLCRSILIYCNISCPPDLIDLPCFARFKEDKQDIPPGKKNFKEPNFNEALMNELKSNKQLLNQGDGDSSSGSDSQPSEDNLQAEELVKNLPTVDKTLKQQLKKNAETKKAEAENPKQSQVKLRRQSSAKKVPEEKKDPPRRNPSPVKKAQKEEEKKDEAKKPKPETRDACTQTDRKDYQLIKAKMLRDRKLKEQQAVAAQQALQDGQDPKLTGSSQPGAVSAQEGMLPSRKDILLNHQIGSRMDPHQLPSSNNQSTDKDRQVRQVPLQQHLNSNGKGLIAGIQMPDHASGQSAGGNPTSLTDHPRRMPITVNTSKYNYQGISVASRQNTHGAIIEDSAHQQLANQQKLMQSYSSTQRSGQHHLQSQHSREMQQPQMYHAGENLQQQKTVGYKSNSKSKQRGMQQQYNEYKTNSRLGDAKGGEKEGFATGSANAGGVLPNSRKGHAESDNNSYNAGPGSSGTTGLGQSSLPVVRTLSGREQFNSTQKQGGGTYGSSNSQGFHATNSNTVTGGIIGSNIAFPPSTIMSSTQGNSKGQARTTNGGVSTSESNYQTLQIMQDISRRHEASRSPALHTTNSRNSNNTFQLPVTKQSGQQPISPQMINDMQQQNFSKSGPRQGANALPSGLQSSKIGLEGKTITENLQINTQHQGMHQNASRQNQNGITRKNSSQHHLINTPSMMKSNNQMGLSPHISQFGSMTGHLTSKKANHVPSNSLQGSNQLRVSYTKSQAGNNWSSSQKGTTGLTSNKMKFKSSGPHQHNSVLMPPNNIFTLQGHSSLKMQGKNTTYNGQAAEASNPNDKLPALNIRSQQRNSNQRTTEGRLAGDETDNSSPTNLKQRIQGSCDQQQPMTNIVLHAANCNPRSHHSHNSSSAVATNGQHRPIGASNGQQQHTGPEYQRTNMAATANTNQQYNSIGAMGNSASHKRNSSGILGASIGQMTPQQHSAKQGGTRTPSQTDMIRGGQIVEHKGGKGGSASKYGTPQGPSVGLSIEGHLNLPIEERYEEKSMSPQQEKNGVRSNNESPILPRFRNQSEIASTRNNQPLNTMNGAGPTTGNNGANIGQYSGRIDYQATGSAAVLGQSIVSPQLTTYQRKSMNGDPQRGGKLIGKRYSRH